MGLGQLAIAAARAQRAAAPLVAIGGIDEARASAIRELGVAGAVIGSLFADSSPTIGVRARALQAALGGETNPRI